MNRTWLSSLLMFVWLTIGYAVVHGIVMIWLGEAIRAVWPMAPGGVHETLEITDEGEALLHPYANGRWQDTYRRLDGTEVSQQLGLGQTFVRPTYVVTADGSEPRSWNGRLDSFHDFRKPATYWYLIAPPDRRQTAYFAGYDATSRRLTGYLGVNGFSLEIPSIEQSFPIKTSQHWAFYACVAAAQDQYRFQSAVEPDATSVEHNYAPVLNVKPDTVWLLSQGTIYEIRLSSRTVNTLLTDRTDLLSINSLRTTRDGKTSLELVASTETGLLVINPETKETQSIQLNRDLSSSTDQIYQLKNGRWVIVVQDHRADPDQPNKETIFWIDDDRKVERQAERTQPKYRASQPVLVWIGVSIGFPTPIVPLSMGLIQPFFIPRYMAQGQSYFEQMMRSYSDAAVWLAITSLISLATGWACRRREREVFHNNSWFWPILVGVCGWFGWMGYICVRPSPARLPNRQWMPSQPEAVRPLGTEIFA